MAPLQCLHLERTKDPVIADRWLASPSPDFRITIAEDHATIALVLHGELDLATEPALRRSINEALDSSPPILILNLSRLAFLDCRGVHVVLDAVEQCARQNTQLQIVPGRRAVQRVFEILQLAEILPFTFPPRHGREIRP